MKSAVNFLVSSMVLVGLAECSMVCAAENAQTGDAGTPARASTRPAEVYTAFPFDAKEAARRQSESAAALEIPGETTVDLGGKVVVKFVLIPAGLCVMGSPATEKGRQSNELQHEVTLTRPFYIGIYKVTQGQYQRVMGENPSTYKGVNFPVAAVSWDAATDFCKKASEITHRKIVLPTEAQWEDMCRAGSATAYCFGDDESKLGAYCWDVFNWSGTMHPVGQKKPNAFGVNDVHGLMWEWARGFYGNYDPAKKVDPDDPSTGTLHVARAGTYRSRPPFLRSAIRLGINVKQDAKGDGSDRFGFRVMMDVD